MNNRYGLAGDQSVGAVILAGGLARRMGGQDKGLIKVAGKPMVQYAVDIQQPLVDALVINANRNIVDYEQFGVPVIQDTLADHQGPLAGLSAALDALPCDYMVMCPCDSPFMQSGLTVSLIESCVSSDSDIAVAHDGERLQPVFCVVHRRVQQSLNDFLASGERKIDRWFSHHSMKKVDAATFADSFVNINTEDERLNAEQVVLK